MKNSTISNLEDRIKNSSLLRYSLAQTKKVKPYGDYRSGRKLRAQYNSGSGLKKGQATKGAGRMPWHWEPMKDVVNCDKLRGVVSRRYIRRFPNGATRLIVDQSTYSE